MIDSNKITKRVVTALIVHEDGRRVLMAMRSPQQTFPNMWEYPGGKIEPGETPEAAIVRELQEGIGVRCTVIGPVLASVRFDFDEICEVMLFRCVILEGQLPPQALVATQLEWVEPKDMLRKHPMTPSTYPFYPRVRFELAYRRFELA